MSTLLELANAGREITVGNDTIKVYGISAEVLISIITKFPAITKAMSGIDSKPEEMIKIAPEAIAEVIAAGTGHPGEADYIKAARKLPVEAQLDILTGIIKQTFPGGVGPFVEKLEGLGVLAQGAVKQGQVVNQSSPPLQEQPTTLSGSDTSTH